MSRPGWGIHNFDLALVRWRREHHPSAELLSQVKNWRDGIEARGLEALEPWAVISDEDGDFVARIPGTEIIVDGTLLAHEQLVIVRSLNGTG